MKKTIYSILALTFVFSGALMSTSCSSDDNSDKEVIVNPNPNPNPNPGDGTEDPTEEGLTISVSSEAAYLGDTVTLSASFNGQDVTNSAVFYVDDAPISGNTITSDSVVEFLVSAKYNGEVSDYVTVSFAENPFLTIEGTGNFTYNGTSVGLDGAYLRAIGVYPDDNGGYTIWWIQYGWSGNNPNSADNYIAVSFDTPAVVQNDQLVDFQLPGANQNVYYSVIAAVQNGQVLVGEQTTDGTGSVVYNTFDNLTNPWTANFAISVSGTHNINFTYEGDISPIASARAKMINGNNKLQIKSLKDKEAERKAIIGKFLNK